MRKFLIFLVLFATISLTSLNAQIIEPIDSTYIAGMDNFNATVNRINENVWPGMSIGPYCIFRLNGPAILINHPNPPQDAKLLKDSIYLLKQGDYQLMGATQTEINGYLTAHNDYGQNQYATVNQFFAELFHELHHVYQRNSVKNLRYDNPADLLTYPEDYRNDAIKQYENEVLLKMLLGNENDFRKNLDTFYTCRKLRNEIIGEKYLDYEKAVESVEGPATYCEYMYMQEFSSAMQEKEYINKRYYFSLIEPHYGRSSLRSRYLLTGMAQCILLSRYVDNWQTEYYQSGKFLNDYFFSKFRLQEVKMPDLSKYEAKARYFTGLEKLKHAVSLKDFNNQNGIKITLQFKQTPEFRGFDPMHAEAVNDSLVLHSTLLKLGKKENYLSAINYKTASVSKGAIWFVKSVEFFAPAEDVHFSDHTFTCNAVSLNISWKYTDKIKNGNEYIITLE